MDKKIQILTYLVIASLVLSIFSVSMLVKLYDRPLPPDKTGQMIQSINLLQSNVSSLSTKLDAMKEEIQWILTEELQPDTGSSTPEEIHLNATWSFREIERGANIYLVYRDISESTWNKVAAKKLTENIFTARLILSPKKDYKYAITAEGNINKTTEPTTIAGTYYKPSPVVFRGMSITQKSDNSISHLSVDYGYLEPVYFDFFRVKRATVNVYREDILDETITLETNSDYFGFELDIDEHITSVTIEFEYGNGTIQTNEVYPEPEKREKPDWEEDTTSKEDTTWKEDTTR